MILQTDYRDCYDHWFDSPSALTPAFRRFSGDRTMSRTAMMCLFDKLNLKHPTYQRVVDFKPHTQLVVYLNQYSHQGTGKILLQQEDAMELYLGDFYATEYKSRHMGRSYRYVVVGKKGFTYGYQSEQGWKSNHGDVEFFCCALQPHRDIDHIIEQCKQITNPLYAIDFVHDHDDRIYVIDFNTAPEIRGTPAQKFFSNCSVASDGILQLLLANIDQSKDYDNNLIHLKDDV